MKRGKTSYHPCGPQRSGNRPWPAPGAAGWSGHSAPCHSWKEKGRVSPGTPGRTSLEAAGNLALGLKVSLLPGRAVPVQPGHQDPQQRFLPPQ